jgi:hypothetical protein
MREITAFSVCPGRPLTRRNVDRQGHSPSARSSRCRCTNSSARQPASLPRTVRRSCDRRRPARAAARGERNGDRSKQRTGGDEHLHPDAQRRLTVPRTIAGISLSFVRPGGNSERRVLGPAAASGRRPHNSIMTWGASAGMLSSVPAHSRTLTGEGALQCL